MNDIVKSYGSYNHRRYSLPWVCRVERGQYDFTERVGLYTGRPGDEGDLIIFDPVDGQVYAYGQKDYRGKNTEISHVIWLDGQFLPCDKIGRLTED